ncbi:RNA binding [Striga asiatica]|uniref:RNA binding n=1 Tax=Striga asiatica TaxID=4170 RepID=A0A5A7P5Q4_STRAF|nr:RNA binding [Striga asiatica]
MAPPSKSLANQTHGHGLGGDPPRENPPSNNLWIGNVSPDVSETELKSLFEKYGKVDSVSAYSSRNYAFIYFKEVDCAKSARQALQGHFLRGNSLKIEFAKPAKPCKSLWVSGISQSISREELEKEFLRYGKIQEFKFLRERNSACVDYIGLEDAIQALKNMNGKRIGGSQLRVDFLRSQPPRREMDPDAKEGHFPSRNMVPFDFRRMGQDPVNSYVDPSLLGSKRTNPFVPMGSQYGDAIASKVLWIRYPPSVILEDDMLHNAMILFGEIERIKTYSDKNYAFVEFRSVDEARRAKEGLQGKLFNDPRILIDYFSDEFPGMSPFQPVQMDLLGHNHPILLGNNPGRPSPRGIHGPDLYTRPPVGSHGPEHVDLSSVSKLQNHSSQTLMGGPAWRRFSPTRGLLSSPSASFIPNRSAPWDVSDATQLQRESKRSRLDASLPPERTKHFSPQSLRSGGASGVLTRSAIGGHGPRLTESDYIWRGLIAKGGTPVCRARCVPVGDGLGADIPDIVLEVDGPERLYGVVLKFPQIAPGSPSLNPHNISAPYTDPPRRPTPQRGYDALAPEERGPHLDNSRVLPEDFKLPPKAPIPVTSHVVPPTTVSPPASLSLTPELIATLTSLLPANNNTPQASSCLPQAPSNVVLGVDTNTSHWKHENQAQVHNGQFLQPQGWPMQHPQASQAQAQAPPPGQFHQELNPYRQHHTGDFTSQGGSSSRLMPPIISMQRGPAPVAAPEINQQYQHGNNLQDVFRGQGIETGADSLKPSFNFPQQMYPVPLSNQMHANASSQPYVPPQPSEVELVHHQSQPALQTAPFGVAQENAETEADKNERYKTTLLFAANLLSRIHQPSGPKYFRAIFRSWNTTKVFQGWGSEQEMPKKSSLYELQ